MKLLRLLDRLEDSLLVVFLTAMIGLAAGQIVLRNLLGEGAVWIDPLLRVLVLWVAMTGAVVAARHDNHIRIDLFTRYLPAAWVMPAQRLVYAITAAVSLLIAWHAGRFVISEYTYASIAFGDVPVWLTAGILPVGFVLIALRYCILAWRPVRPEHPVLHS